ncbi:MAG: serine hydrolase [Deltaproteobacteria bacterium]|jgi:beta-lactamase class A|nr:serine hydrolase [Deltaproteobacteria bacterium]MBW2518695.1 serine hydrolase [Deltaproteobacteria bacterium]
MDRLKQLLALIFFVLICASLTGAQSADDYWTQSCDPRLQKALEKRINALKLDGATEHKNLSIVVVDITDVSDPRMAYVNPNEMMYAASLPKIAILLGAFEKIAAGEMTLDDETLEKLKQMIRRSSNSAASEMLDRVGIDYLAELLQSPRYRLYDPENGGGIWVGKEYGKAPARKRDPLHNLSHGATALQVARFYYLLETGQLVSPQLSELMKAILAETEIEHKFVKGIRSVQPDSEIYRKSGTWGPYHSDSAIIEHDGRRYIAVALAKSHQGEQWLQKLIVALDEVVCQTVTNQN